MKPNPPPQTTAPATLQTVLDRLTADAGLPKTRKRDLRSAVTSFAKLTPFDRKSTASDTPERNVPPHVPRAFG